MPFFNHAMARSIQPPSQVALQLQKQTRSMPGNAPNGATVVNVEPQPATKERYRYGITQRKLLFTRSLIRAQVEQVEKATLPFPIEQCEKLFQSYAIDRNNRLHEEDQSVMQIYGARCTTYPEIPLLVRIYSRAELNPDTSLFVKILRHLGRKHHYVVNTFDLFSDATSVYVFQELTPKGNLMQYLSEQTTASVIDEKQVQFWAKQLYRALDFLGDQAIAHRSISPNHILMNQTGHELGIKLTGFKHSIIYWDCVANDVRYCACWPASRQRDDGPNFQAPEVYGNPNTEEFDPILADTWSYGANVYYMLAKQYPYNMFGTCEDIEGDTQANIRQIAGLTEDGHTFLAGLLRANANERPPFEFVSKESWLHSKTKAIIETPYKSLQKMKLSHKSTTPSDLAPKSHLSKSFSSSVPNPVKADTNQSTSLGANHPMTAAPAPSSVGDAHISSTAKPASSSMAKGYAPTTSSKDASNSGAGSSSSTALSAAATTGGSSLVPSAMTPSTSALGATKGKVLVKSKMKNKSQSRSNVSISKQASAN